MSDIQFDEPGGDYSRKVFSKQSEVSGIPALIIKLGFAKTVQQANIVLIAIAIFSAIIAYIFWPSQKQIIVPQPGIQTEQNR